MRWQSEPETESSHAQSYSIAPVEDDDIKVDEAIARLVL
jgi:hypothetical protein